MTVTALDAKTALIVIDLQKGLAAIPTLHPIEHVTTNVNTMAKAFRSKGLPVILVTVAGAPTVRTERPPRTHVFPEGWTDFMPELDQSPSDHIVTKYTPGAFTHTDLEFYLRAHSITQVVLTGIATSNGVEVTARQAYELGFNIAFAVDAMTDVDAEAHTYSTTRVFPKIGQTGTTGDILALLKQGTPS